MLITYSKVNLDHSVLECDALPFGTLRYSLASILRLFYTGDRVAGNWCASDREYTVSSEVFHTGVCLRSLQSADYCCHSCLVARRRGGLHRRQQNHAVVCEL
jgi:hypothetical protein